MLDTPAILLPLADIGDVILGILMLGVAIIVTFISNLKKKHKLPDRSNSPERGRTVNLDERIRERRMEREAKRRALREAKQLRREARSRRHGSPSVAEMPKERIAAPPPPTVIISEPRQRVVPRRPEPARPKPTPQPRRIPAPAPSAAPVVSEQEIGGGKRRRRSSGKSSPADKLRELLQEKGTARSIIVATEVLGPPAALREDRY